MSDTTLNRYLTYGTNAARLAFTPSPPAGVNLLYVWEETDTGDTYVYDTTWHLLSSGGGGGGGITALSGDVVAVGPGTAAAVLSATTATPGTFGSSTQAAVITVDVKGRITASSQTAIAGGGDVTGPASSVDSEGVLFSSTTGKVLKRATGTGVVHRTSGVDSVGAVVLSSEVSGDLPFSNLVQASAASKLVGRGSAGGAGDFEEITPGNSVAITTTTLDTIQDIRTSATPQFARLGLGAAADSGAVLKAVGQYYSPMVADGNSGTTKTINFNDGNEHYLTLTGNVTLTLTNPKDGGRYVFFINTGAGSFTITWPTAGGSGGVQWPSGTAPTITATASKRDLITMIYSATDDRYFGAFNQNYSV